MRPTTTGADVDAAVRLAIVAAAVLWAAMLLLLLLPRASGASTPRTAAAISTSNSTAIAKSIPTSDSISTSTSTSAATSTSTSDSTERTDIKRRHGKLTQPTRLVVAIDADHDLRDSRAQPRIQRLLRHVGGAEVRRLSFAITIDVRDGRAARALLALEPDVRWVELDERLHVRLRRVPDDPLYVNQWHLEAHDNSVAAEASIGAEAAWDSSTGLKPGGDAVRVAILDDGFDLAHPDLAARFLTPGFDASTAGSTDSDPSYESADIHGTQTAGVVAATAFAGNGLGVGVVGVCPQCAILPVRLIGGGGGPEDLMTDGSAAAAAIEWAVDNGAEVINNSWGPDDRSLFDPSGPSTLYHVPAVITEALRRAAQLGRGGLGAVITWAAGNGAELAAYDRFASDPRVLAVGSINAAARLATYSDWGPTIALVAPSSGRVDEPKITTTDISGILGRNDGDYTDQFGGTSASSAMVAGVAALVIARYPYLTAAQVTEALFLAAEPVDMQRGVYDPTTGRSLLYGHGRVDALGAMLRAGDYEDMGVCTLALEICGNGRDDNCNGVLDDDEEACASACVPQPEGYELCNGVDDNCDGRIDEDFACVSSGRPLCAPCNASATCASGLQCSSHPRFGGQWCFPTCTDGLDCPPRFGNCVSGLCLLEVGPETLDCVDFARCFHVEACDGVDNDCNGAIDDLAAATAQPDDPRLEQVQCPHAGVCAGETAVCIDGVWRCAAPSNWQAVETRCDGLDNDCDVEIDEAAACASRADDDDDGGGGGGGCAQLPAAVGLAHAAAAGPSAPIWILLLLTAWARWRVVPR